MNKRFNPEISVVRPAIGAPTWVPTGISVDVDDQIPERALLVRGVPMVGERVNDGSRFDATVAGHIIWLVLGADNGEQFAALATRCSPVPDEDEALVDRVMEAIRTAGHMWQDNPGCGMSLSELEARAAIRAMKEKK